MPRRRARLEEHADHVAPRPHGLEPARERPTADELHHEEHARVDRTDLVNRHDVRMAEACHRLRLAHELQAGGRPRVAAAHDLERDAAVEIRIVGLEHHAHPTGAELADHAEVADRGARRERSHGGHPIVGGMVERHVFHEAADSTPQARPDQAQPRRVAAARKASTLRLIQSGRRDGLGRTSTEAGAASRRTSAAGRPLQSRQRVRSVTLRGGPSTIVPAVSVTCSGQSLNVAVATRAKSRIDRDALHDRFQRPRRRDDSIHYAGGTATAMRCRGSSQTFRP